MEHITERYGEARNDLLVTPQEYDALNGFLTKLGIRCRCKMVMKVNGKIKFLIEADNPYEKYSKVTADKLMTPAELARYKM